MKKIGLLYGKEVEFSQKVIETINAQKISKLVAEEVKIGILYQDSANKYAVVLDRFAEMLPFYHSAMMSFKQNGAVIVNDINEQIFNEEFLYLSALKKLKINVPKTALIPSKELPHNITGEMLGNLVYPLNWDELFDKIKFPAQVKSNSMINDFYDCFRVYNINDFFSIYDMSGSNSLILQEDIKSSTYYKIFVTGNKKYILNYDWFKAPKDRYSELSENIAKEINLKIDNIVKVIRKNYNLDIFVMDIAISDELYVMRLDKSQTDFDNSFIPPACYDWLVKETAALLIDYATPKPKKIPKAKEK